MKPCLPAFALCCAVVGTSSAQVPATMPASEANLLTLSVSATVEVPHDVLAITFATQREAPDAATVQSQLMQALEPALAEARKVARPDAVEVSTGNFSVMPRYAPKGEVTRWAGTVELRVEGRDVATLTRLVGRIQTLSVAHVAYSLSREARDKVQADVSAQAIARFRSQAQAHAKAFGFGAYTLREVQLNTNESPNPPMPMFRAARADAAMTAEAALPVEAGRASVSTTVSGTVRMQ